MIFEYVILKQLVTSTIIVDVGYETKSRKISWYCLKYFLTSNVLASNKSVDFIILKEDTCLPCFRDVKILSFKRPEQLTARRKIFLLKQPWLEFPLVCAAITRRFPPRALNGNPSMNALRGRVCVHWRISILQLPGSCVTLLLLPIIGCLCKHRHVWCVGTD